MNTFTEIIESVKKFDYEELQELNFLTSKYIENIEEEKIANAHIDSLNEYKNGELEFSSDINTLKEMLDIWWFR